MVAIRRRRSDFALLNMATMDNVDFFIMRRLTFSRRVVVCIPRWRKKARLPNKVTMRGTPGNFHNIARFPHRRPDSDCGNRSPINDGWTTR